MPDAKPAPVEEEAPKVETASPPPAPMAEAAPAAPGLRRRPPANSQPMPISGQSPPPSYPAALRAGETGMVVVSVDDATGYPNNATVIQRSGSRASSTATDAAAGAFTPAQSNGQATRQH